MFLENIIVVNYRSCKSLDIRFSEDIPNVFIGLNDSGKSSVLHAIDLLLSPKSKYNFYGEGNHKSDLSNSLVSEEEVRDILLGKDLPIFPFKKESTVILGKLKYQEDEAIFFEELNLSNHLQWSIESNDNEEFWLAKEFYDGKTQIYLLTKESESSSLWNENQQALNKLIKEKSISPTDIENENGKGRFSNIEKLRAIYAVLECEIVWTEYNYSKNDKEFFPSFSLFDWNSSLEEIISTANAIMQEEINAHLKPVRDIANDSAKEAEIVINKKFGEISKIISEVAKDVEGISSRVFFDVKEKISDIMVTKTFSDGPIHLENQGEGLKRQIWFSLIKAKADTSQESLNKFIWAFDEPETHLYPGAQREFFDILNKLSEGNVQTIISTHSTIFIDKSSLDTINSVKQKNGGYTEINYCKDITSIYSSLNVKNSDFLFYDKFLVVEGDTEQYLILRLFEIYAGKSLLSSNIQLLNMQGKNKWVDNKKIIDKILGDFKKSEDQVFYLFDNDMSFEIGGAVITENMFFVGNQDIEDAISDEIWLSNLNDYYEEVLEFNIEEVRHWKKLVPVGVKCNDYEKFYPILNRKIKSKFKGLDMNTDTFKRIPSKGIESADFLLSNISSADDIPLKIREAFDMILT